MALLVNDVTPTVQYTASSGQTTFAYPFAIFEDADLKVYQVSSGGTPDDVNDILTLTTHYTVSGEGTTSGGDVVLVTGATTGDVITITRDLAVKRTTDYQANGDLASTSFNDDLDKLVMMVQQNEDGLNRALTLANSTQVPGNFDVDDPIAGYFARAKSDLSGIEWLDTQSVGNLAVSAYIETLLDDPTSLAARATLEIIKEGVYRGIAEGAADVITVPLSPTMTALSDGQVIFVRALLANATTTPTINVDSLGAKTIVKEGSQALVVGDIARADHDLILKYNAGNDEFELLNPLNIATTTSKGIVELATDAEVAIGTDTSRVPPVSSLGKHITACKAWVNFNGTGTVAIRNSYNVSSITDNGTGDYTVNFTNAIANADYVPTGFVGYNAGGTGWVGGTGATQTTTALRINTLLYTEIATDFAHIHISVFGD